jgi:hypothetical protein
MPDEMTIPVLPCVSLPEILDFYRLLGFEVTHKQTAPYAYGAVRRGDIHLHFHGVPGLDPAKAYSTCLWMVPEVEDLHRTLIEALRSAYGKVPIRGAPRISRWRRGESRFTVVDPSGNSVIVIRLDEHARRGEAKGQQEGPVSWLARAIKQAARDRDFMNDDAVAARTLDAALAQDKPAPAFDRARALVARAELAVALGELERLRSLRAELDRLALSAEERERLREETEALHALERSQR